MDSLPSSFDFYQGKAVEEGFLLSKHQQENHLQLFLDYGVSDQLYFDALSPIQPSQEEIAKFSTIQTIFEPKKENPNPNPNPFPIASLGILNNYGKGFRRLNGKELNLPIFDTKPTFRRLSTEEVIRLAGEKFIQSSSQSIDHPFASSLLELSYEEWRDVEIVQYLLVSAEKAGLGQFYRASKLLNRCDQLCSSTGNPVERVGFYFSKALHEKIDLSMGRKTSNGLGEKQSFDIEVEMMSLNPTALACHQTMPFAQVAQFTGMQSVIENVAEAKKIHLIDLEIRNGVQCTVLMQALATRCGPKVELLKITAVGTKSKQKIEETGERLVSFAQTLNLPFSFKIVMVSNIIDLNEDLFELEEDQTVAVYSQYALMFMISHPNKLENLMRVIRNLNPCIMVVFEVEANHNSPIFVNRFIEALFFFGAYFDCFEDCMERNDPNRMITESEYFSRGIQNILVAEGEERTIRNVKIDVWRVFFARFGMREMEMSESSLYQARLLVKKFGCEKSCTLDNNGKSMIIGWKGIPLFSLSAWKFNWEEEEEMSK